MFGPHPSHSQSRLDMAQTVSRRSIATDTYPGSNPGQFSGTLSVQSCCRKGFFSSIWVFPCQCHPASATYFFIYLSTTIYRLINRQHPWTTRLKAVFFQYFCGRTREDKRCICLDSNRIYQNKKQLSCKFHSKIHVIITDKVLNS